MPYNARHDICRRCDEGPKYLKGRGLCESCWMQVKALHAFDEWPRLDVLKTKAPGYCRCFAPVRQALALFGACQCMRCGKKLPDAS